MDLGKSHLCIESMQDRQTVTSDQTQIPEPFLPIMRSLPESSAGEGEAIDLFEGVEVDPPPPPPPPTPESSGGREGEGTAGRGGGIDDGGGGGALAGGSDGGGNEGGKDGAG